MTHQAGKAVPDRARSGSTPGRPGAGAILTLVNGVLAGVGGVYVSTRSTPITIIAAAAAIVLTAMILVRRG